MTVRTQADFDAAYAAGAREMRMEGDGTIVLGAGAWIADVLMPALARWRATRAQAADDREHDTWRQS